MSDWGKLSSKAPEDPKIIAAEDDVGDAAWTVWTKAICYANRNETDGFVPSAVVRTFTRHRKPGAVTKSLVDRGLLEEVDGGFVVHGFLNWNPSSAKLESKRNADRLRKDSKKTPDGFRTESDATSDGVQDDSDTHAHACSRAGGRGRSRSSSPSGSSDPRDPEGDGDPFARLRRAYSEAVNAAIGRSDDADDRFVFPSEQRERSSFELVIGQRAASKTPDEREAWVRKTAARFVADVPPEFAGGYHPTAWAKWLNRSGAPGPGRLERRTPKGSAQQPLPEDAPWAE